MRFFNNCVGWNSADVHSEGGLCDLISGCKSITRKTFQRHTHPVDRAQLEQALGYAPHDPSAKLTMRRDFHVSYHKSKLHGQTVYLFKHSAIEYIFTP